jgi:hypothetical protein
MTRTRAVLLTLVPAVVLAVACAREAPPPPAKNIVNQVLGIELAAVPPELEVMVNEGDSLVLAPVDDATGGQLAFSVGPEVEGVNLVAAVNRHRRLIEERPGADYKGAQELVTPLGPAFYSRGRYLAGTTETEETVVFVQHPSSSRLLSLSYRYPAGVDSSVRVQQLLEVLSEVQAITEGEAKP